MCLGEKTAVNRKKKGKFSLCASGQNWCPRLSNRAGSLNNVEKNHRKFHSYFSTNRSLIQRPFWMMDLVTHYFSLSFSIVSLSRKSIRAKKESILYTSEKWIYEQMFSSEVFCLFSSCAVMVKRPFGALIVLKIRSQWHGAWICVIAALLGQPMA